jgi:hypothetical protein
MLLRLQPTVTEATAAEKNRAPIILFMAGRSVRERNASGKAETRSHRASLRAAMDALYASGSESGFVGQGAVHIADCGISQVAQSELWPSC